MPAYTVRKRVDAWVTYECTVEADTPQQASQKAREQEDSFNWEECYTSTFDARQFVTLDPESGGEIDESTIGDI